MSLIIFLMAGVRNTGWTPVVFPCGWPFRMFWISIMKTLPGTLWYGHLSHVPDSSLRTNSGWGAPGGHCWALDTACPLFSSLTPTSPLGFLGLAGNQGNYSTSSKEKPRLQGLTGSISVKNTDVFNRLSTV